MAAPSLTSQIQGVKGNNQEPLGPACLLLKPLRHTRAFREDGAGAGAAGRPELPSLCHGWSEKRFPEHVGAGVVSGGLWNVRVQPGPLPASALCGHGHGARGWHRTLVCTLFSGVRDQGAVRGPAGGRTGPGPPSQERPASSGGPPSLAPAPLWVRPGGAPPGSRASRSPQHPPLPTQVPVCTGGSDAR